jgi:hypothetical protein
LTRRGAADHQRRYWLSHGPAAAQQGRLYPADPPTVEEIVAVMREAGDDRTATGCAR